MAADCCLQHFCISEGQGRESNPMGQSPSIRKDRHASRWDPLWGGALGPIWLWGAVELGWAVRVLPQAQLPVEGLRWQVSCKLLVVRR